MSMKQVYDKELYYMLCESISRELNERRHKGVGNGHTGKKNYPIAMGSDGEIARNVKCTPENFRKAVNSKSKWTPEKRDERRAKEKQDKNARKEKYFKKQTEQQKIKDLKLKQTEMNLKETVSRIIKNYIR